MKEVVPVFLDVPGVLFTTDGVPAALVSAGEPWFRRRAERLPAPAAERVHARPRTTSMQRGLRPAAS